MPLRRVPMRLHAFTELANTKGVGSVFGLLSPLLGAFSSYQERQYSNINCSEAKPDFNTKRLMTGLAK
jgi:hypothetical protein